MRCISICPCYAARGDGAPSALGALSLQCHGHACGGRRCACARGVAARAPTARLLATLVRRDAAARAALRANVRCWEALRAALLVARTVAVAVAPHAAPRPAGAPRRCLMCHANEAEKMEEGASGSRDDAELLGGWERRCSLRIVDATLEALTGRPDAAAAAAEEAAARLLAQEEAEAAVARTAGGNRAHTLQQRQQRRTTRAILCVCGLGYKRWESGTQRRTTPRLRPAGPSPEPASRRSPPSPGTAAARARARPFACHCCVRMPASCSAFLTRFLVNRDHRC
jgi:hypothetical protein